MKKTIIAVVAVFLVLLIQKPLEVVALDLPEVQQQTNRYYVEQLVDFYSEKYGVNADKMMQTIRNENDTFDTNRQSELKYKKGNRWKFPAGTQEKSYGLAMIHLPDHPHITKEQATNPHFAVEFMAKEFAKGNQSKWMGYEK